MREAQPPIGRVPDDDTADDRAARYSWVRCVVTIVTGADEQKRMTENNRKSVGEEQKQKQKQEQKQKR